MTVSITALNLAEALSVRAYRLGEARSFDAMEAARDEFRGVAQRFPDNPEIQLERARGNRSVMVASARQDRQQEFVAAYENLRALAAAHPEHLGIQEIASEFGVSYAQQRRR